MSAVPHGGTLVNRVVEAESREAWLERVSSLPRLVVSSRQLSDLELIAVGAYSPLAGFMGRRDYDSVLEQERLAGGLPWTVPITLKVGEEDAKRVANSSAIALTNAEGGAVSVLELEEAFRCDREREAERVFLTSSASHPGVAQLKSAGEYCLAGRISLVKRGDPGMFARYALDPKDTRAVFLERGWNTIVGFQTRNPVHRAHEYILKCALETVDGLLLHPLVGDTREEDIPAEVRLRCYVAFLEAALPASRALLAVYPAAMRYAGPREAIFHALVRKNYGCTHFIVGRDHAGVGNFYGPYDAQRKFEQFGDELGITPVCFDASFYCYKCGQMASEKTCPHGRQDRLVLSGTRVRELLRNGADLPQEFTRPDVAEVLRAAYRVEKT